MREGMKSKKKAKQFY